MASYRQVNLDFLRPEEVLKAQREMAARLLAKGTGFDLTTRGALAQALLHLGDHERILEIGLEHLCVLTQAHSGGAGLAPSLGRTYTPSVCLGASGRSINGMLNTQWDITDPIVHGVFNDSKPLVVDDVAISGQLGRWRSVFAEKKVTQMIAQRISIKGCVVGLITLHRVGGKKSWSSGGVQDSHTFAEVGLAPILDLSKKLHLSQRTINFDELTVSEWMVAELVCKGLSDKQIAFRLGKSVKTVHNQMSSIRAKTGVVNRTQLTAIMYQNASAVYV